MTQPSPTTSTETAASAPAARTAVAIHQPNFLPWLGWFYKLRHADVFVILDDVQFTKGGYTNRTRLPSGSETSWLSVPVRRTGLETTIRQLEIGDPKALVKHRRTLQQQYGRCPAFAEVDALLEGPYDAAITAGAGHALAQFNLDLIRAVAEYLGIEARVVRQSELGITGQRNELLADLVQAVSGSLYVSGAGGRGYMEGEEQVYAERGVTVAFQAFTPPEYPQGKGPFVAGCSILDALFHLGRDAAALLEAQQDPPWQEWRT